MKKIIATAIAIVIMIFQIPARAIDANAVPSTWSVFVNGEYKPLKGYNIAGTNYYKLRDIAMAVNGSEKQFEVKWDSETKEIHMNSQTPYTVVGGELSEYEAEQAVMAETTKSPVYLDGELKSFDAYYINGNNYFKLRDILKTFNIGLVWNNADKTVWINTELSYSDNDSESKADISKQVVVVRKLDEYRNTLSESLGFIISQDGDIATTFQAIRGAEIVTVSRPGEKEYDIDGVVAYAAEKNIAVLKSDIVSDEIINVKDSLAQPGEQISVYALTGKNKVEGINGKVLGSTTGFRDRDQVDIIANVKLPQNSIGAPAVDASGNIVGMAFSGVYQGMEQQMIIPASEIFSLNLNGTVKSLEQVRREQYLFAGNAGIGMLTSMLRKEVDKFYLGDEYIPVFNVRAEVTDSVSKRIYIRVLIAENDGDAYEFREHSLTTEGGERIFEYCKTMIDVALDYFPDYEFLGEITCGLTSEIEWDEEGNPTKHSFYPNEEDEGSKVTFGYGSQYNGWSFRVE